MLRQDSDVNFLKLKLENLKPQLKMCVPLANALIIGLEKRFQSLFDDDFHLLATITHPEFKDMDDERFNFDTETKVKAKTLFVNELQKVIPNDEKNMQETNCDQKEEIHGFFPAKKKAKTQESALDMVERYVRTENLESNELLKSFQCDKSIDKYSCLIFHERIVSETSVFFNQSMER